MRSSSSEIPLADYFRVVFLGRIGVGKTSIIRWILDLPPLNEYFPTIGLRYHNLDTVFNNNQYFLQFCDVSGHEAYSNMLTSFLKGATVVILVFDYKSKDSQLEIQKLYSFVCDNISPTRVFLVGNKFENEKREIPKTLASWAKTHNLTICPISVRENLGKSLLLQNIIRIIDIDISSKQTKKNS